MEEPTEIPASLAPDESDSWLQEADPPAHRTDLLVDPKSKRWATVHKHFTKALKSEAPIKNIIRDVFTHHQYRMLAPAERADVKELQAANTKRYNALLAGRFKGVEDSLATKLTMMYFGLPAAPVDNPLEEIAMMMGLDEKEVPRYNVKPPLHFLTAYDHRNWGKDSLKSNEAVNYPLPLPKVIEPTLGLRGGESDYDTNILSDDYIPKDETPALFQDGWTYMYGLYGRLPFVPRKWRSFSKVLRQLLQVEDNEKQVFSLLWFDLKVGKPQYIHDELPLTKDSPAVAFLHEHFTSSTKSHKDCCVLFVDDVHTEPNKGPQHWEPVAGQLKTDTARIGRSLGHAPNGPEYEVVSYAYMAFPKTKAPTFNIGKYGCNQYNAHFSETLNILFGAPEDSIHHHALFQLYDRNKPDAVWTVPIVYGAMSLPQWVWELLHPLNNPDACWMVGCCWLDFGVEAILMPNYYPYPNPYLITGRIHDAAAPFDQAYRQVCEMTAEAFDASTARKIDSVFLVDGYKERSVDDFRIDGFQVEPERHLDMETTEVQRSLGRKLQESPNFYRTVQVNWRPGHCRLFPDWYSGGDVSVEMPRLTSTVEQFFGAIEELYRLVAPPNSKDKDPQDSYFLLKEAPSFDSIQVQDMDSPAYFIGTGATDDDWYDIRRSITSPIVTVSVVKSKSTDWSTSISKANIWGLRLGQETLRGKESTRGELKREVLFLQDPDGQLIDMFDGYPADPVPLEPINPKDDLSRMDKGTIWSPMSRHRSEAFVPPKLLKVKNKSAGSSGGLHFPSTQVIEGAITPDGKAEYDIGILATSRPQFHGFPSWPSEHEDSNDFTSRLAEEDDRRRQRTSGSLFGGETDYERLDEDGGGGDSGNDGDDKDNEENEDKDDDGDGDAIMKEINIRKFRKFLEENEAEYELQNVVTSPSVPPPKSHLRASKTAGPDNRAHTWATQPSIFTTEDQRAWPADAEIGLPITAAPVEKIHRLSSNVPMFSKSILTPTEQADLQHGFWDLRNMLLKRTNMCPFKNCNFTWRLDEHEELNIHAQTVHAKQKCPFCDDALFPWWDKDQKIKHMRDEHPIEVKKMTGPGMQGGNVSASARVNVPAEKTSQPPQQTGFGVTSAPSASRPSSFNPLVPAAASIKNPFVQGDVHDPFKTPSVTRPTTTAATAPAAIKAPTNLIAQAFVDEIKSWGPQNKLKEPPRLLTFPLLDWYDHPGTTAVQDPPKECPIPGCLVPNIGHLSSHGVWRHFKNYHPDFRMDACPFCRLSFCYFGKKDKDGVRAIIRQDDDECIKHMDCHVYQLWDILEPLDRRWPKVNMPSYDSGDFHTVSAETLNRLRAEKEAKKFKDVKQATTPAPPTVAPQPGATQSVVSQATSPQAAGLQTTAGIPTSAQGNQQPADAAQVPKKCAYFEKCGAYVESMSHQQYRQHVRISHPKEISILSSSDEDVDEKEEASYDSDGDPGDDGDDGQNGGGKKTPLKARRLKPAPKPAPKPTPKHTQAPPPKSAQRATSGKSSALNSDEMDVSSDIDMVGAESSGSKGSAVLVSKKPRATRKSTPKTPVTDAESGANEQSDVPSTVSRGRRSARAPRPSRKAATTTTDADAEEDAEADAEEDAEEDAGTDGDTDGDTEANAGGSGSKSSNTVGRGRSTKKARRRRPTGDNDGEYEDDGYETEEFEEQDDDRPALRRRAKSPDWVKELGPEDPNFDPDDKMYCSKCLRKAPKRRTKSPNRSPIGRASELESHTDKTRCCRIRNAIGSAKRLPNRSGWIPASKLPGALGVLKEKFLNRYPTYMRTMYPTHHKDHHASVWRSDPNNPDNKEWWDIPWPPYEGLPPFPGEWQAPGLPWDDTPAGRQRRAMYIGNRVVDPTYRYQTDSDSGDDIQPDVDDIPGFQSDMTASLKRPATDADDTDGPPPKKPKSSKTAASKTPTAKGTKKSRGAKPAKPSKASGKTRQQGTNASASVSASATTSAAPSAPPSNAGDDEDV